MTSYKDQKQQSMADDNGMGKSSAMDVLLETLASVKLTIFLLIILSIASLVGTFVTDANNPSTYDVFSSWWFTLLLFLLCLNIIVCSLRRYPSIRSAASPLRNPTNSSILKGFENRDSMELKGSRDSLALRFQDAFKKKGYEWQELGTPPDATSAETILYVSERGRWTRYGFYVTHLSMILIMVGVIVGYISGYKGFMQINEGDSSDVVYLRNSESTRTIPFKLRCDDFDVTFYEQMNQVKDYKCTLTVLEKDREILTKTIEVNDPLDYSGLRFFQNSYGQISFNPRQDKLKLIVRDASSGKERITGQVTLFQPLVLDTEKGKASFSIIDFVPDFVMDSQGRVGSRSGQMNNPAVKIQYKRDGKVVDESWTFARHPDFHMGSKQSPFRYSVAFPQGFYTVLQVTKDPGVIYVYLGGILLSLGIIAVFFLSHRRYYILFQPKSKGRWRITISAKTNKNRIALRHDFPYMMDFLKEEVNKK